MQKKNSKAISNEEIIAALLQSGTVKDAAAAVGVTPRTVYSRMEDREFKAAYKAAKADIIRQAVYSINGKLSDAIDAVADIMTDKGNNAAVRLQAAQTILNNAGKFAERLAKEERDVETAQKPPIDFSDLLGGL